MTVDTTLETTIMLMRKRIYRLPRLVAGGEGKEG
jgi:hypothetical protein